MKHMTDAIVYIDGASKGNPGPAAIGIVVCLPTRVLKISREIGISTNNQAEYHAAIEGVKTAIENGARRVKLLTDSELLTKQLKGEYKVKNKNIHQLMQLLKKYIANLEAFEVQHIPRERNMEADKLASQALEKVE
ncbi:MAG: ribonuclease HI family protein [Candidatus Korarchaeota archaeon]